MRGTMKAPIKPVTLSALSLALSFVLTACSGGSKGAGQPTTPVINANPSNTTQTNTNPSSTTQSNAAQSNTAPSNALLTGRTSSNTGGNIRSFGVATDYKGDNELRVNRPADAIASEIRQVLAHTNRLRAEKGLSPLTLNENLSAYAQVRAEETVAVFAHQRPNGQSWNVAVEGRTGENLAAGNKTGEATVQQWRDSTTHYQAIMTPEFTTVGIGVVYVPNSKYGYYWAQIFGDANTQSPYNFNDTTSTISSTPLQTVLINGVSIPVHFSSDGSWRHVTGNSYQSWTAGYNVTRFGATKFNTSDHFNVFYQGLQTPEHAMPTQGTATYTGRGLMVRGNTVSANLDATLNVNFANKTLAGTLTQNGTTLYGLSADIYGSSFASKSDASVQTEGAFFGNNAEELSGIFRDTKSDTMGAFGAKK